jgi:pyruvate dehydrogenase E1 component alpha subunit
MQQQGLASATDLADIDQEIDKEVRDAVEFALAAPEPDPDELTRYIWAED